MGASFVTNKRKCIDEMECALCIAGEEILEQQFIKYPITKKNYVGSMPQSPCPIRLEGFNVTEKFRLKKIHTFCGNQK